MLMWSTHHSQCTRPLAAGCKANLYTVWDDLSSRANNFHPLFYTLAMQLKLSMIQVLRRLLRSSTLGICWHQGQMGSRCETVMIWLKRLFWHCPCQDKDKLPIVPTSTVRKDIFWQNPFSDNPTLLHYTCCMLFPKSISVAMLTW